MARQGSQFRLRGSRREIVGLLAGLGAAIGCSTVPPPVVSPVARTAYGNAVTWSVDWGYASAHIQRPDGTTQAISGNGDDSFGSGDPGDTAESFIVPALISLHQFNDGWDTGEYAGWRRFGGTARWRLATTSGGAATSIASALNAHWSLRGVDGSVALEQSVPLHPSVTALFRAGVGYGLRDYDLKVPMDLEAPPGASASGGPVIGDARFDILRADLRLEPLVGLVAGGGSVILSFQPYFVLAHGAVAVSECQGCVTGVKLLDFTQNRGFAVAVTLLQP